MKFQVRPRAPVTRATTLGTKTRRIFKIITLESQKIVHRWSSNSNLRTKLPKFIIVQKKKISHSLSSQEEILHLRSTLSKHFRTSSTSLPSQHSSSDDSRDETCKNDHRPKKRSITFLILARRDPPPSIDSFKHFRTSPTCLDPLTTFPLVRTPQLGQRFQTFPNIPLVRRKKRSNSILEPASQIRPSTVSRERSRGPVPRRRNLAGLPGYQVDSEAESPGRRVHLRGCKARGSVGNRHRRAAASVRVFAWARTRPYCRGVGRIGGSSRKRRVRAGHSGGAGAMTSHRGNLVVVG